MPVDTTSQQLTDSGSAIDKILPCNENSDFNQQLTNTDSVPVPQSHTDTELPLEMNIIETTSQQLAETASDIVQSDSAPLPPPENIKSQTVKAFYGRGSKRKMPSTVTITKRQRRMPTRYTDW